MMNLLRLLVTSAWFGCFFMAFRAAGTTNGDMAAIGYMMIGIFLGIAMSAVWTPVIAEFLCGSLDVLDECTYIERRSRLNKAIDWASRNKYFPLLVFLCLVKGFLRPELPSAFIKGLKHSKPGSWAQKMFARRVYRFNNAHNSLQAAKVLEEHGEKPAGHHNPEVIIFLMEEEKKRKMDKTQRIRVIPPEPRLPLLSDTTTQLPSVG